MRGLRDPPDDPDGPRGAPPRAAPRRARLGDWLLREDDPLRPNVRRPHPPWTRAPVRDGDQAREPEPQGPLRLRGRGRPRDRRRALRERGPPKPRHAVRDPRQRGVRPHEGPGGADPEARPYTPL